MGRGSGSGYEGWGRKFDSSRRHHFYRNTQENIHTRIPTGNATRTPEPEHPNQGTHSRTPAPIHSQQNTRTKAPTAELLHKTPAPEPPNQNARTKAPTAEPPHKTPTPERLLIFEIYAHDFKKCGKHFLSYGKCYRCGFVHCESTGADFFMKLFEK